MSYSLTQSDILAVRADAAVLSLEITMGISDGAACAQLARAGGEQLRQVMKQQHFIPVGSAVAAEMEGLPFPYLILTAAPQWLTGKANELLVLHRCYESIYEQAEQLGCRRIAMPFLSALNYGFPREAAVHIALREAEKRELETVFAADTPELLALAGRPYRKPRVVSYVGYYRDHALFALDNGLFARVDLRQENARADVIPYFEACYRAGNNPLQPPLPEAEIDRLRRIYEDSEL